MIINNKKRWLTRLKNQSRTFGGRLGFLPLVAMQPHPLTNSLSQFPQESHFQHQKAAPQQTHPLAAQD